MSGLYIHIPFCKQACNYCNFHFSTSLQHVEAILESMCKEIQQKAHLLNAEQLQTIYFGGGSPSILTTKQLQSIVNCIQNTVNTKHVIEMTLEANPDDMSAEKLNDWLSLGFNRLSVGIQSFRDEDLKMMNRAHNQEQAIAAIKVAQQIGFNNLSIDLIYGIPGLSNADWINNLATAISLNIPHISSYCLTVEPKTVLAHQIKNKQIQALDDEQANIQFMLLIEQLAANGIEQYEISNFAKSGFESKHNSAYWQGVHYIGIGPGAHSFNGTHRTWNISNNQLYHKAIANNEVYFETENLSVFDRYNEYLMTGLRTREGVEKTMHEKLKSDLPKSPSPIKFSKWIDQGQLIENNTHYYLSKSARFFADGIAADLFESPNSI